MTIGLVARADNGGLGAQTWEMWRHLRPARTLIVDLGAAGRGRCQLDRYDGSPALRVTRGLPDAIDMVWLLNGVRAVYTAEGTYGPDLPKLAAEAGVRLVVHANPELWDETYRGATTTVVTPTGWEVDRIPGATVMPMPVDRDRCAYQPRSEARRFLFPWAPAFLDRHGWRLVQAAFRAVKVPTTLVIGGMDRPARPYRIGRCRVESVGPRDDYWSVYPDADVLVLPRRYAGLSLPIQEALACGMPVVMLDLPPYGGVPGVVGVPVGASTDHYMRGGVFPVYDTPARTIARAIERLVDEPRLVADLSASTQTWAEHMDWRLWEPRWQALLAG